MQRRDDFKKANSLQVQHLSEHLKKVAESNNIPLPTQSFDRTNSLQDYYKQLRRLNGNFVESTIGLQVATLSRQQQDLTFYCLSYLEAQTQLPLKLFVVNGNVVWVEVKMLHESADSPSAVETEKKAKNFLQAVRRLLQQFIEANINWKRMTEDSYQDTKVIDQFKRQVIDKVEGLYNLHVLKK